MPWGVDAHGLIFGTSYALLAMGLILIYRTTRIVNFAYGAMGAMPGSLTVGLFMAKGWNYWLAIALGLIVGAGSGALVDILVIRRFARSSRRSEEHTSELQSLMRISYAVFCLKKKKLNTTRLHTHQHT